MTLLISIDWQPIPTAWNTALIKVWIPPQVGDNDPELWNVLDGTVNAIIKDWANRILGGLFKSYNWLSSFGGHSVKLAKINDYGIDWTFRHYFKSTDTINTMIEYLDWYLVWWIFTDYNWTACNGLVYISTTWVLLDNWSIWSISFVWYADSTIFVVLTTGALLKVNNDKTTTSITTWVSWLVGMGNYFYITSALNVHKYDKDWVLLLSTTTTGTSQSIATDWVNIFVSEFNIYKYNADLSLITSYPLDIGSYQISNISDYIYCISFNNIRILNLSLSLIASGTIDNVYNISIKNPAILVWSTIVTNTGKEYIINWANVDYVRQKYNTFNNWYFLLNNFVSTWVYNAIQRYNSISLIWVATIDNEYWLVTKNVYTDTTIPMYKFWNDYFYHDSQSVYMVRSWVVSLVAYVTPPTTWTWVISWIINLDNDNIIVYGSWRIATWSSVNWTAKDRVAKVNKNTWVVDTTRCATSPNSNINWSIEAGDDIIFVWAFTTWNGTTWRNRIVAVNKSNGAVNTTNRPSFWVWFSWTITTTAGQQIPIVKDTSNNLYINIQTARAYQWWSNTRLHKILYGGLKDSTFATNVGILANFQDDRLQVMEIVGSHLHIANTWTISWMSWQNLYRINLDGTPAQIYKGFNGTVQAIALSDDWKKMLAGWLFTEYDWKPVTNLASIILSL